MVTPYIGEVRFFGGYFAPADWHLCDGSLLSISQYSTLYTLIGTQFGGDGQTTFGLPDLRGRLPMGQGNGPGLSPRVLGEIGGTEKVTLTTLQMAQHAHGLIAQATPATSEAPTGGSLAQPQDTGALYLDPTGVTSTDVMLAPDSLQVSGGSQAHNNLMPALVGTYIIALTGIFPSRN